MRHAGTKPLQHSAIWRYEKTGMGGKESATTPPSSASWQIADVGWGDCQQASEKSATGSWQLGASEGAQKQGPAPLRRCDNAKISHDGVGPVSFLARQPSWLSNDASHYWGQVGTGSQGLTKALLPPPVWARPIYRLQLHQQPLEEILLTHCRPTVRDSTWILFYNFRQQSESHYERVFL